MAGTLIWFQTTDRIYAHINAKPTQPCSFKVLCTLSSLPVILFFLIYIRAGRRDGESNTFLWQQKWYKVWKYDEWNVSRDRKKDTQSLQLKRERKRARCEPPEANERLGKQSMISAQVKWANPPLFSWKQMRGFFVGVVHEVWRASESSGGLFKTQMARPHIHSFCSSGSWVRDKNMQL